VTNNNRIGKLNLKNQLFRLIPSRYAQRRCKKIVAELNRELTAPDNLEEVNCYLCKSAGSSLMCTLSGLTYRKCPGCGLVFVSPRLKEAVYARVYDKYYWWERRKAFGEQTLSERVASNRDAAQNVVGLLAPYSAGGLLLDIGCGDGAVVYAASRKGFEAYGVELSDFLIQYATALYPSIRVYKSITLLPSHIIQQGFQLILLRDVIEHLYEPQEELRKINAMLRRDGYLYLETVNTDDPEFSRCPATWTHSKPYEHPYLFSKAHVDRMLDAAGFKLVARFPVVANRYHVLAQKGA
jgi:2-polyprenyl-3-methyl-5-hydroxy-6-metoxy-1,4-benzoquinol methylase